MALPPLPDRLCEVLVEFDQLDDQAIGEIANRLGVTAGKILPLLASMLATSLDVNFPEGVLRDKLSAALYAQYKVEKKTFAIILSHMKQGIDYSTNSFIKWRIDELSSRETRPTRQILNMWEMRAIASVADPIHTFNRPEAVACENKLLDMTQILFNQLNLLNSGRSHYPHEIRQLGNSVALRVRLANGAGANISWKMVVQLYHDKVEGVLMAAGQLLDNYPFRHLCPQQDPPQLLAVAFSNPMPFQEYLHELTCLAMQSFFRHEGHPLPAEIKKELRSCFAESESFRRDLLYFLTDVNQEIPKGQYEDYFIACRMIVQYMEHQIKECNTEEGSRVVLWAFRSNRNYVQGLHRADFRGVMPPNRTDPRSVVPLIESLQFLYKKNGENFLENALNLLLIFMPFRAKEGEDNEQLYRDFVESLVTCCSYPHAIATTKDISNFAIIDHKESFKAKSAFCNALFELLPNCLEGKTREFFLLICDSKEANALEMVKTFNFLLQIEQQEQVSAEHYFKAMRYFLQGKLRPGHFSILAAFGWAEDIHRTLELLIAALDSGDCVEITSDARLNKTSDFSHMLPHLIKVLNYEGLSDPSSRAITLLQRTKDRASNDDVEKIRESGLYRYFLNQEHLHIQRLHPIALFQLLIITVKVPDNAMAYQAIMEMNDQLGIKGEVNAELYLRAVYYYLKGVISPYRISLLALYEWEARLKLYEQAEKKALQEKGWPFDPQRWEIEKLNRTLSLLLRTKELRYPEPVIVNEHGKVIEEESDPIPLFNALALARPEKRVLIEEVFNLFAEHLNEGNPLSDALRREQLQRFISTPPAAEHRDKKHLEWCVEFVKKNKFRLTKAQELYLFVEVVAMQENPEQLRRVIDLLELVEQFCNVKLDGNTFTLLVTYHPEIDLNKAISYFHELKELRDELLIPQMIEKIMLPPRLPVEIANKIQNLSEIFVKEKGGANGKKSSRSDELARDEVQPIQRIGNLQGYLYNATIPRKYAHFLRFIPRVCSIKEAPFSAHFNLYIGLEHGTLVPMQDNNKSTWGYWEASGEGFTFHFLMREENRCATYSGHAFLGINPMHIKEYYMFFHDLKRICCAHFNEIPYETQESASRHSSSSSSGSGPKSAVDTLVEMAVNLTPTRLRKPLQREAPDSPSQRLLPQPVYPVDEIENQPKNLGELLDFFADTQEEWDEIAKAFVENLPESIRRTSDVKEEQELLEGAVFKFLVQCRKEIRLIHASLATHKQREDDQQDLPERLEYNYLLEKASQGTIIPSESGLQHHLISSLQNDYFSSKREMELLVPKLDDLKEREAIDWELETLQVSENGLHPLRSPLKIIGKKTADINFCDEEQEAVLGEDFGYDAFQSEAYELQLSTVYRNQPVMVRVIYPLDQLETKEGFQRNLSWQIALLKSHFYKRRLESS